MSNWEAIDDILPIGILVSDEEDQFEINEADFEQGNSITTYQNQTHIPFFCIENWDEKTELLSCQRYLSPVFEEIEYYEDPIDSDDSDSQISQSSSK